MATDHDPATPASNTGFRIFSSVLGVLLFGSGVYALCFVREGGTPQLLGALALMLVGANEILAAARARPSWLSRLGPLP